MLIHCPACAEFSDAPQGGSGLGETLHDCPNCGNDASGQSELPALIPLPALRSTPRTLADRDPDIHDMIAAAAEARKVYLVTRRRRQLRSAAWLGLLFSATAPAVAALAMPEQTVGLIPASIRLYDRLGWEVNVYGLAIRQVDLQHLVMDGKEVLALKGELANVSATARKIPWLRFGLKSADGSEVYHWTLNTEVRPLQPGESTSFVTRLASPPAAASSVEIRFARAGEIGSNATP